MVLVHLAECAAFLAGTLNDSLLNPFWQGLPGWLALFAIALFFGNIPAKCILTLLLVLQTAEAAVAIFLALVFALPLCADAFGVLAVSSREEIREFCRIFVSPVCVISVLLFIGAITALLTLLWKSTLEKSRYLYILAVLLLVPQVVNTVRYTLRKDYKKIYKANSVGRLVQSFRQYTEGTRHLEKMTKAPELPQNIKAAHSEKMTFVWVLGESATRFHHSVYGYPRNTSPELSKRRSELLVFDNVISGYAHTCQSCEYMFSTQEYTNKKDFRFTLIDVFRQAGFKVTLLSNQYRWGRFDSPISFMTAHAHERFYLQEVKAGAYDDMLYPELCRVLEAGDQPKLIILHLIGSHSTYESRFPASAKVFNKDNRIKNIPYRVNKLQAIDDYDNSILFTDKLLGKVCEALSKRKEPAFMLYCSDHGDSPEEMKRKPRSGASTTEEHYEIPFVAYGNAAYRSKFSDLWTAAAKNVNRAFMTDWLMYPMFAAAGISFDQFPDNKNLFSANYVPPAKRFLGNTGKQYKYRKNPYLQAASVKKAPRK